MGSLEERVRNFLDKLYENYEGDTVVLVTHVYVIKSILDMTYDLPTGWHANRLWLTNGAVTLLDWSPDSNERLVHYVNCMF